MAEKKKELTQEDRNECARLKLIYNENRQALGLTQETLGALMGISQGAVTQYLNEHTKIGDLTLYKFSYHLKFDPEKVRPGFYKLHPELRQGGEPLTQEELELLGTVKRISSLDPTSTEMLESIVSILEKR